jgi:hypothetical protein
MTQLNPSSQFVNRSLNSAQRGLENTAPRKSLWRKLFRYLPEPIRWPYWGWFGGVQIYQKRGQP